MIAPGPSPAELESILSAATRVPDHGKLAPWRIVEIGKDRREAFATMLEQAYRIEVPNAGRLEIDAMHQFAYQGETLIVVLSRPVMTSKIPVWEQELSAGALCMNILSAVHAHGFVGCWLTGPATYSDMVCRSIGQADDRICGFIFIGSPGRPLEDRPRPELARILTRWDD